MYKTDGLDIRMTEGDYGIILPIELEVENDETFDTNDYFDIKIYDKLNTEPIINKTYLYRDLENNTIPFTLTEAETSLLKIGVYLYDIEWYQNNVFKCCIVERKTYTITEKAGKVGDGS